ncbi:MULTISPECIES: hypothetical protein [Kitasatospora]|nr:MULTISPECIES: hypothetical protein [Kitasatospora]
MKLAHRIMIGLVVVLGVAAGLSHTDGLGPQPRSVLANTEITWP